MEQHNMIQFLLGCLRFCCHFALCSKLYTLTKELTISARTTVLHVRISL